MDKKYIYWIWHGEDDPNEVVRDDDDTEDDSDVAEPVEHNDFSSIRHRNWIQQLRSHA